MENSLYLVICNISRLKGARTQALYSCPCRLSTWLSKKKSMLKAELDAVIKAACAKFKTSVCCCHQLELSNLSCVGETVPLELSDKDTSTVTVPRIICMYRSCLAGFLDRQLYCSNLHSFEIRVKQMG